MKLKQTCKLTKMCPFQKLMQCILCGLTYEGSLVRIRMSVLMVTLGPLYILLSILNVCVCVCVCVYCPCVEKVNKNKLVIKKKLVT
jgi:hypothetical protein